jgi:hypothetical protein
VLALGDTYKDYLSDLASTAEGDVVEAEGQRLRDTFAKTVEGLNLTQEELEAYHVLLGITDDQVETAITISINEGELFALTTTIELLQSLDGLTPEITAQISKAVLERDFEEVRRLLETPVEVAVYGDTAPGIAAVGEWRLNEAGDPVFIPATTDSNPAAQALGVWRLDEEGNPVLVPADANTAPSVEQLRQFREEEERKKTTLPVGIDDSEARSQAAQLFFDIGKLAPTIKVGIELSADAAAAVGGLAGIGAGRLAAGSAGSGFGGKLGGQAPYPGGYDGNPATPYPRAKGGPVGPGRDYLVGEEGPEIVTFGAAGTVIPAGPTAQLMQPTASMGNDKGQAELLAALRDLAAAQAQASGDTITVYETTAPRQTADEILRVKQANRFLAGR